MILFIGR